MSPMQEWAQKGRNRGQRQVRRGLEGFLRVCQFGEPTHRPDQEGRNEDKEEERKAVRTI